MAASAGRLRVILTSGYNEQEVAPCFLGKKLAGFSQKPFQNAWGLSNR